MSANILLVDDHRENLVALEAILEPLGNEIFSVTSGEAALRELLQREFAVILLDVQMPGLDGFETAALIKQRERTRNARHLRDGHLDRGRARFPRHSAGAGGLRLQAVQPGRDALEGRRVRRAQPPQRRSASAGGGSAPQREIPPRCANPSAIVIASSQRRCRRSSGSRIPPVRRRTTTTGVVRLHRARPRSGHARRLAHRDAPRRRGRVDREAPGVDRVRRHLRDRIPLPRGRRQLPLAPRTRRPRPRRGRRGRSLGRHRDRHRRPEAQRRDAAVPPRGKHDAREHAVLLDHAREPRPPRRPPPRDWCAIEPRGRGRRAARGRGRARRREEDCARTRAAQPLSGIRRGEAARRRSPARATRSSWHTSRRR